MAIGKVRANAASLREHNPDFLGAVREVQLHLEIELGGTVGFGSDFDGEGGRLRNSRADDSSTWLVSEN
jgi:hypothetical protein